MRGGAMRGGAAPKSHTQCWCPLTHRRPFLYPPQPPPRSLLLRLRTLDDDIWTRNIIGQVHSSTGIDNE